MTAATMIKPLAISCRYASTPRKVNPLVITPRMSVPIRVAVTNPTPPERLVPPITAAVMASSSYPIPIPA